MTLIKFIMTLVSLALLQFLNQTAPKEKASFEKTEKWIIRFFGNPTVKSKTGG